MKQLLETRQAALLFLLVLLIVLTICLSGCATEIKKTAITPFPEPGRKVADELEKNCYPQSKCPATWDWIDRLYKLKDQLKSQTLEP